MRRPKTNRSFILLDKDVTVGISVTVFVPLAAVAQKKINAATLFERLPRSNVTKDLVERSLNCFVKVSNDSRLKISYPCPKGSNLRPCRTALVLPYAGANVEKKKVVRTFRVSPFFFILFPPTRYLFCALLSNFFALFYSLSYAPVLPGGLRCSLREEAVKRSAAHTTAMIIEVCGW